MWSDGSTIILTFVVVVVVAAAAAAAAAVAAAAAAVNVVISFLCAFGDFSRYFISCLLLHNLN